MARETVAASNAHIAPLSRPAVTNSPESTRGSPGVAAVCGTISAAQPGPSLRATGCPQSPGCVSVRGKIRHNPPVRSKPRPGSCFQSAARQFLSMNSVRTHVGPAPKHPTPPLHYRVITVASDNVPASLRPSVPPCLRPFPPAKSLICAPQKHETLDTLRFCQSPHAAGRCFSGPFSCHAARTALSRSAPSTLRSVLRRPALPPAAAVRARVFGLAFSAGCSHDASPLNRRRSEWPRTRRCRRS